MLNAQDERPKILIVDDEPTNLQILRQVLHEDYRLLFARDGEKAVQLATDELPNLILLDVMMPDMDGYAVCERLQAQPQTVGIPVVYVTALGSTAQEVKGLNTGAIDYITKPINGDIVKARVRNHLKFRKAAQAPAVAEEPADARMAQMTERQQEIFRWVREGKTNWEIARIVGCSEENVKYHMKNILRIMGSYNRTQAVARHPRAKTTND